MVAKLIDTLSPSFVEEAKAVLISGGLVAIPTETVYGLAANGFDEAAVVQIFKVKERPAFDPLILHVAHERSSLEQLHDCGLIDKEQLDSNARDGFQRLRTNFWPGPLTLVLPRGPKVPQLVTSGLPTVGIRVPKHPALQSLLKACEFPLAAPSANLFGRVSPTTAGDVLRDLGDRLPLIVDGGQTMVGVESSIVMLEKEGAFTLLRQGGIAKGSLEEILEGRLVLVSKSDKVRAPGMLTRHYAPQVPLHLLSPGEMVPDVSKKFVGVLQVCREEVIDINKLEANAANIVECWLTEGTDSTEAARNLFRCLREFEDRRVDFIIAREPQLDGGLWPAIRDRLLRAKHR
jgi:L-threonylcarbamoyladenylate synthase